MITVALASDKNLIRQLGVTAISAAKRSSAALNFKFFTGHAEAEHQDWPGVVDAVRRYGSTAQVCSLNLDTDNLQLGLRLTVATYYRLLLPELLPDVDRAVYLDCDLLVKRDLVELWDVELQNHSLAAVPDLTFARWDRLGIDRSSGYFNAGVLLMDLKAIRSKGSFKHALEFARANPSSLTYSDNCALNKVFERQWRQLPEHWNYQHVNFERDIRESGLAYATRAAMDSVIHFNNYDRPWSFESAHPLKAEYREATADHPELRPHAPRSLKGLYTRCKRIAKWHLLSASARSNSERGVNNA